uniref:Uncharacterized protein n=1 Tax=Knipowitschia caucasica TaxID=637954 RepID=A0AAV2JGY6_KNICA
MSKAFTLDSSPPLLSPPPAHLRCPIPSTVAQDKSAAIELPCGDYIHEGRDVSGAQTSFAFLVLSADLEGELQHYNKYCYCCDRTAASAAAAAAERVPPGGGQLRQIVFKLRNWIALTSQDLI